MPAALQATVRRRWQFRRPADDQQIQILAKRYALSLPAAAILAQRSAGDLAAADFYLQAGLEQLPDPNEIPGLTKAVRALLSAIYARRRIAIFGDYDADGITGTALLARFFCDAGIDVTALVPDRADGYGLMPESVRKLKQMGIDLILTVDNGIAALPAANEASRLGLDLVITDHHRYGPILPTALAHVHPGLDKHYQGLWRHASGAGLALALVLGLRRALREAGYFAQIKEPQLAEALQLAAVGTVADVVPLIGVNRLIVREGIRRIRRKPAQSLAAILKNAGVRPDSVDEESLAFTIGPRINAAGRITSASLALACLTASDDTCLSLAQQLESANRARRRSEDQVVDELERYWSQDPAIADAGILFAAHPDWNHGVLGIVAGRAARRYGKPVVLMQIQGQQAKGSARSIASIDILEVLEAGRSYCLSLGGHKDAAGMTVAIEHLGPFRNAIVHKMQELGDLPPPQLDIDATLPLRVVSANFIDELKAFAPFGPGNPRPLFASDAVQMQQGRLLQNKHLSFRVPTGAGLLGGIAFQSPHLLALAQGPVQLAFCPTYDTYRAADTLQLICEDIRPAPF